MIDSTIANDRPRRAVRAAEHFLESLNDESFTEVFRTFTPQLVSYFRAHGCARDLSEDLSQEVMLTLYRKSGQIRDRTRLRSWLFTVGRHTLYRHCRKRSPKVDTVDLESVIDANTKLAGSPAFEFHQWISLLESREREALTLRFVEEWEYHEIAAAKAIPIGTVQSQVFNAQKKLARHLKAPELPGRKVV
jgi:RNA polymerase sigma-70 factor (ECF subfamily)